MRYLACTLLIACYCFIFTDVEAQITQEKDLYGKWTIVKYTINERTLLDISDTEMVFKNAIAIAKEHTGVLSKDDSLIVITNCLKNIENVSKTYMIFYSNGYVVATNNNFNNADVESVDTALYTYNENTSTLSIKGDESTDKMRVSIINDVLILTYNLADVSAVASFKRSSEKIKQPLQIK